MSEWHIAVLVRKTWKSLNRSNSMHIHNGYIHACSPILTEQWRPMQHFRSVTVRHLSQYQTHRREVQYVRRHTSTRAKSSFSCIRTHCCQKCKHCYRQRFATADGSWCISWCFPVVEYERCSSCSNNPRLKPRPIGVVRSIASTIRHLHWCFNWYD